MARLAHAESRRLYSWWWDSHISPKNSKWLQENLADMDAKVKLMIKLLEEDADSFARRAEMYYKKRPELLKLVEDFYRAYRALAERYDHATGALRHAHKTIAEVLPNQFASTDVPISPASVVDEPHAPEMPVPMHERDDLQNNVSSQSARSLSSKKNITHCEEYDALNCRKGLKQLNDMFASDEVTTNPKFVKGRIQEVENKEGAHEETRSLQDDSRTFTDSQNLKWQGKSEVDNDVHELERSLLHLEAEKLSIVFQYYNSLERNSNFEKEMSHAQEDGEKLKNEILFMLARLESVQLHCSQIELEKLTLEKEAKILAQQTNQLVQELVQKQDELEKLKFSVQDETIRYTEAAATILSLETLYSESLERLRILEQEMHCQSEILRNMESINSGLEEEIRRFKEDNTSLKKELGTTQDELRTLMFDMQRNVDVLKDMELKGQSLEGKIQDVTEINESLNNQVLSSSLMINNLQQEILKLKGTQLKLENEAAYHLQEKKSLQHEVYYLKEGIVNVDKEYQFVLHQIKAVGLNKETLQVSIKDLQDENFELKALCKSQKDENMIILGKLECMENVMEKNIFLEASLSDATGELEWLREKVRTLEESSESLNNKIADLVLGNNSLVMQSEKTSKNMEKLSDDNAFLGNALSEANVELEGLRGRLKSLEESSQYLLNENTNLQCEKNKLVSQMENIHYSLEDIERKYAQLEEKHLNLEQEKESTLLVVSELQNLLKLEKQGHEAFILSSNNQLMALTDLVNLIEKEGCKRDEELESTQHELLNSQTEAFIMQICLLDSKKNTSRLARSILNLMREVQMLEEENDCLLSEVASLHFLCVTLEKFGHEKIIDLRACCNCLGLLQNANSHLQEDLGKKKLELAEINQSCKFTESVNTKLYSELELIKVKFDEAMDANEEVEKRVYMLMEDNSRKEKEIANICETNEMFSTKINALSEELSVLKAKHHLMSELKSEMKKYEEEVARHWYDAHSSSIHVGIFEEKILELIGECERLEVIVMAQRKVTEEQLIRTDECTKELMQKLDTCESETEKLRAQVNAYLPPVLSLQKAIYSLGGLILSLLDHHGSDRNQMQGSPLTTFECGKNSQQHSEHPSKTEADGVLVLRKLQLKVKELHKDLEDHWGTLLQKNSDASATSKAVITDIVMLAPEKSFSGDAAQEDRCAIKEHEEDLQGTGKRLELQSSDSVGSKGNYELIMKDIQLDRASYDAETGIEEISGDANQMLGSWEIVEKELNNQVPKMTKSMTVITEEEDAYHHTEVLDEEKPRRAFKLAAEKELAVDKPVALGKVKASQQDWSTKILECLASDAQRLSVLLKTAQELKTILEKSQKNGPPTNKKYDAVRWQLREAEETISQLFDMNSGLTKKAEECCAASGGSVEEPDELKNQKRRRVSDRARRGSERIGRLELEMQRIQYTLKVAGEQENRARDAKRRPKVILSDYLYGKREIDRRKAPPFCSCVQTKTG